MSRFWDMGCGRFQSHSTLRQQQLDQPLLCGELGAVFHLVELLFAHHVDGDLDEVAHDGLNVAANVADLGKLRRLHLEERRVRQLCQPSCNLGFADAGRADHEDVLRHDLFGEIGRQLLPSRAVAQRNRHSTLGSSLTNDILIKLSDDLARRHLVE